MENASIRLFADPPAMYRPMVQWSWNGRMTPERIREQIAEFAEQRCGGVFIYPRPGCRIEYLSDEWFRLWRFALDECRAAGLECHLYDEFTCPSGHAGGHVVARVPQTATRILDSVVIRHPEQCVVGDILATYRQNADGIVQRVPARSLRQASAEAPVLALVLRSTPPRGHGFALPDLTRPEATRTFIEVTHERYRTAGREAFGQNCRFVFTDEPQLRPGEGLILSRYLLKEFHRDHGYDLLDRLAELCFELPETPAVRFDYFSTVNRLFIGNFMKPLYAWCEENDLLFSGHLIESASLKPTAQPSLMAALRWMHAPGTDLLAFQFHPTIAEENAPWYVIQLMLRSVGRQLGREWRLCESCGANGYGYDVAQFKPLEDFLLALGVSVLDPHLTHETLVGGRKYEWPQTLSDHSPWWAYYHLQSDHSARVNAVLSQGTESARILLLLPTTTAWIRYQAPTFRAQDAADPLAGIAEEVTELVVALYGHQIEFDLGDEDILAELGGVEGARLCVGEASYDTVLLPATMENCQGKTLALLRDVLAGGGTVHALGNPPALVDGRSSEAPRGLAAAHPDQWHHVGTVADLLDICRETSPPELASEDGSALPAALMWRVVTLPGGDRLVFLANPWAAPLQTRLRLPGRFLTTLDTGTGQAFSGHTETIGAGQVADLDLPPWGHALWLLTDHAPDGAGPAPSRGGRGGHSVSLSLRSIERSSDNLLVLDYCDMFSVGREALDIATIRADTLNWSWQGFDHHPWRGSQYARNVLDAPVDPDSELILRYHFDLAPALPTHTRGSLRIAIERPVLYEIRLNGHRIDPDIGSRWFDEEMRVFPVGGMMRNGRNTLELVARPFTVLCEIAPVIVMGDFALENGDRGFRLAPPRPLGMGDWTKQGLPFYHQRVRYRFAFELDAAAAGLRLELPEWGGALAEVVLVGGAPGVILHPPFALDLSGPFPAGEHALTIDVVGNMKNRMGPHFSDGLAGWWSWSDCPENMPPGETYRFHPTGLFKPPLLTAIRMGGR